MKKVALIYEMVKKALHSFGIFDKEFSVVHPGDMSHGDYSVSVAMQLARDLRKNPRQIAEDIIKTFSEKEKDFFESIEIAGAGYINFTVKKEDLLEEFGKILLQRGTYGSQQVEEKGFYVVEFSSPNIAKPFTIGHLRSTIIGDSIARILAFYGRDVIRDNHLGDWGAQYGKLMTALDVWGDEEELITSDNPIKYLVDLYVKYHQEEDKDESLKERARDVYYRLEKGEEGLLDKHEFLSKLSKKEFEKVYDRLGVDFNTWWGESMFVKDAKYVIEDLREKNLVQEKDGVLFVEFEDERLGVLPVLKSDGTTLYATRDLATDRYRKSFYGDDAVVINEVGAEQSLYFEQIFEIEEMLGYFPKEQRVHVKHGLYRFAEGKMSTRKGNTVWLEDVLDKGQKSVLDAGYGISKDDAEIVSIGGIKFNDLSRDSENDIDFNWEAILNFKGDTGPYIQYTCVRGVSAIQGIDVSFEKFQEEKTLEFNDFEIDLMRTMSLFPEKLETSAEKYQPFHLARFLLSLARQYNTFYEKVRIVDKGKVRKEAAYVTAAATTMLKQGLHLLGIKVPKKM